MAVSAGILVHRKGPDGPEVLLGHPGGPLWRKRDAGVWTVPKGGAQDGEDLLAAAIREFTEETGLQISGDFRPLAPIRQKAGKLVLCWAVERDLDLAGFAPGAFEMEWPPRSGRRERFSEIDQLRFFTVAQAAERILPAQLPLVLEAVG